MNLLGIWVNAAFDVWTGGARVCSGHSGGGADLAMGWVHPNGALRGHVVDKTVGGGGRRGSPMDLGRLSGDPRGPVGRVLPWWGCAQWVSGAGQ
jgi:hypothetical protein